MRPSASSKRIQRHQSHASGEATEVDFEHIWELACFGAAQVLKAMGETSERLNEVADWRSSSAFTTREKAALSLSKSISSSGSKESSRYILEQARHYFDTAEMVRLTMALVAVNDWISLHSDPTLRILVIEDNPLDQELLRVQLQKAEMGNNVAFVSDGLRALELLTGPDSESFRRNLAAIFLDIHLPRMNGIELLRRIRALPDMNDLPVIVMTSTNDPHDIEACHRLKATFIQKPVTYSSFFNAVADIFHGTSV